MAVRRNRTSQRTHAQNRTANKRITDFPTEFLLSQIVDNINAQFLLTIFDTIHFQTLQNRFGNL